MKSEMKLFNKKLYITNIIRLWPCWTLATIVSLIIAVSGWMSLSNYHNTTTDRLNVYVARYLCFDVITSALPVMCFVTAGVIGIGLWSFLCSRSGVDFMHSLPLGRKTIFFTNALSMYTMVVVPYIPALFLYMIVSARYGVFIGMASLQVLFVILVEGLVFTSLSIFASILGGTVVSQVSMYLLINFISIISAYVLSAFTGEFLYGMNNYEASRVTFFFSPVFFFESIQSSVLYEEVMIYCKFPGAPYFIIYAVLSLVFIALTFLVYMKRKSEAAMEFIVFKSVKTVLLYVMAVIGTILFSILLYSVFDTNFSSTVMLFPMLICVILGCVICFFVSLMIVNRTTKVINLKNVKKCTLFVAVMVLITLALGFDICGVSRKIPNADEISILNITYGSDNIYITADEKELLELAQNIQREVIEEGPRNGAKWNDCYSLNLLYEYQLKSGKKITRNYYIPTREENMNDSESLECKLTEFVKNPLVYRSKCYIGVGDTEYTYAYLNGWIDGENSLSVDEQIPYEKLGELRAAIEADFAEGNMAEESLFYDYEGTYLFVEIEAEDYRRYKGGNETVYEGNDGPIEKQYTSAYGYGSRISLKYNPGMKNLTKFLLENHLAEEYLTNQ